MAIEIQTAAPSVAGDCSIGVASIPNGLDKRLETSTAAAPVRCTIHEILIEHDPFTHGGGLRGLATDWKAIDDTSMELPLLDGVAFRIGATMDAQDVEASLAPMIDLESPHYGNPHGQKSYELVAVEGVDDITDRIHTKRPDTLMETLLSLRIAGIRLGPGRPSSRGPCVCGVRAVSCVSGG